MRLTIEKKMVILIFLLIPFFKPIGLSYYVFINRIFQIWKFISLTGVMYILIKNRNVTFDKHIVGLIIFWLIYIFNSLINNTECFDIINNATTCIILIAFVKVQVKENKEQFLDALKMIFVTYIVLQVLSVLFINITGIVLFEPIKNDYVYFLGTDNYSAFALIPMLSIIIYNNTTKHKLLCLENILLLVLVIGCNIYTKSYSAAFACAMLVVFLLIYQYKNEILNKNLIKKILAVLLVLLILIVVFDVQDIFSNYLVGIGKGVTLNSRTIIWDDAINLINDRPLLGHGELPDDVIESYALYGVEHAHNIFLDLLLRTGIIGTISYLYFICGIDSINQKNGKEKVLVIGLMALIILSFMDFYPNIQYQYCLIGLIYCLKNVEIQKEKRKKNDKRVGIVILNYNNYKETINCVESVLKQQDIPLSIVIVDNGSQNNSFEELTTIYSEFENIHLISSKENLGYAKGNNLGIRYLREQGIEYIFIANSDICLSSERIIKQMLDEYEEKVGVIIPIIKNPDGTIDRRVAYKRKLLYLRIIKKILQINLPKLKNTNNEKVNKSVEENKELIGLLEDNYVISGSGFLLTPDFFENYNGLYPKTFLYFEEWATIIYLHKANLYSKVVETDTIMHKGAASSYKEEDAEKIKLKYMQDSSKKILTLIFKPKKYLKKC